MPKKQTMYIETTVISAYFDFKKQDLERKKVTRNFWNTVPPNYTPVISDAVLVELRNVPENKHGVKFLEHVSSIQELPSTPKVENIAQKYTDNNIIRKTKLEDALHLAHAVVHEIDFLVSWNYKDLVRATQKRKITIYHQKQNLHLPTITTPLEFFNV